METTLDMGFCSLEFRDGFMIATITPKSTISEEETLRLTVAKREKYGESSVGLVLFNPSNASIAKSLFSGAESIMKEQGYSFLIVARPNPTSSAMLELFNKHCLIYVGNSLEDAISHAESMVKSAACA